MPYDVEMGGTETGGYPFTGNGFTKVMNGQVISEYKCNGYLKAEDGAELIEIYKDGTEKLRAIYSKSNRKFIPV